MLTAIKDGDTIFSTAIEIASPEQRDAYIAQACGNDAALKQQVNERIAAHFRDEVGDHRADGFGPGTRIGAYKLVKQLGEDAASVVFLAEQQEPQRRLVAVKILKDRTDGRPSIARWEAERQALARIDHANIATLFDIGTLPAGHPYFVTELVKGTPLTAYCDEYQLPPRQRLELFESVCQAVQHAHQKGVIHGDLKPSKVLVANYDGKPAAKVIDFVVSEATRQHLNERTLSAASDGWAGTLEYLSPEQANFNAPDIDTRSDVYSLGVLLYELLTGTTPLTRERLRQAGMAEALRLIREEEAPPPSTRLSESQANLAAAARRHVEPAELVQTVQGELDAVVVKALQKDRTRRYDTVSGLAHDIQRYLADEPVEAYPSNASYQLRKWARKYPRARLTASALLLLLLTAAVGGAIVAVRAWRLEEQALTEVKQAKEESEQARKDETVLKARLEVAEAGQRTAASDRDQEVAAENAAKDSADDTKLVLKFLQDKMLAVGRSKEWADGLGKNVKLRDAVDVAAKKVAKAFADRPLAEAAIRETLGAAYLDLEAAPAAVEQYERALALREAMLGHDHPDTVDCRNKLAVAYRQAGRTDEADRLNVLKGDSPSHAAALAVNGAVLLSQKKPVEAEMKLRECLAIRQKIQPDNWTTFETKSILGDALVDQKKFADAERLLLSGYEGMKQREKKIPADAKDRLTDALERLVRFYEAWGKPDKAAKWRKELEAPKAAKKS